MRYLYLSIVLLSCFLPGTSPAQNLVPNYSFEGYNTCPANLSSILYSFDYTVFPAVKDWTNPCRKSSPDYMNSCAGAGSGLTVPSTIFGYQHALSGNGYAGIIPFQGQYNSSGGFVNDYREYLQVKLTQPLVSGKIYCVSFFVNPTVSSSFNFNYLGLDEIGVDLSVNRPLDTSNQTMSLNYDVRSKPGVFLTDTARWYEVRGTYQATGGEEWLTLGTFKINNSIPPYVSIYPLIPNQNVLYWSYVFIDDVSVRELSASDTSGTSKDTVVCMGTGLQLDLTAANGTAYSWNNGSSGQTYTATDTGTYWCTSIQDCGVIRDTFRIKYRANKTLELGPDIWNCFGQPVTVKVNNVYPSYQWNTGASTDEITVNQSGTYIVAVNDVCGLQKDTINVYIQSPTPAPIVRDTAICQEAMSPTLTVEGTGLKWYPSNGPIGIPNQPFISTRNVGVQTLFVTQTIGKCESERVPVEVTVKYKPKADIGDYMNVCAGVDTLIGKVHPEVTYLWNTNEMVCCIKPRQSGKYQLTITNDCGTSTDTAYVEIHPCDDCLFLPTAFTPNGDGRNDSYLPLTKCAVDEYSLIIYSRWGEPVFRSVEIGKGWDGLYNGNTSDAGVYIYLMEYRSAVTGARKSLKGNVTLIR